MSHIVDDQSRRTLGATLATIAPAYSAREHTRAAERMVQDMEKNTHTPGPWVAERNHDHDWVVSQPGNDGQVIVALRYVDGPEWEANAKLLASAPDLLAACETLADYFAGHDPNDIPAECGSGVRAALIQARAAIAKAKGVGSET